MLLNFNLNINFEKNNSFNDMALLYKFHQMRIFKIIASISGGLFKKIITKSVPGTSVKPKVLFLFNISYRFKFLYFLIFLHYSIYIYNLYLLKFSFKTYAMRGVQKNMVYLKSK